MIFDFTKFGNGNWNSKEETEEAFSSYFKAHYLPLLNKLADTTDSLTDEDKTLCGFMRDDFTNMFIKE